MSKFWKILIALSAFFICIYFLVSIQIKQEVTAGIVNPQFMMETTDVVFRIWDRELLSWEMRADSSVYFDKNKLMILGVYDGVFPDGDGGSSVKSLRVSTVDANLFSKKFVMNDVELVLANNKDDEVIVRTDRLVFFNNILSNNEASFLNINNWVVSADGMKFNQKDKFVELISNVKVIGDGHTINSKRLIYDFENNVFNLVGRVIYSKGDRVVFSDKCSYRLSSRTLLMVGHVKIIESDKEIKSDSVKIDLDSDEILFKGNVKTKLKI